MSNEKDNMINSLSTKNRTWGKQKKICPKCEDVYIIPLYARFSFDNQVHQYAPSLEYCVKCDSVYKVYYLEETPDVLKTNNDFIPIFSESTYDPVIESFLKSDFKLVKVIMEGKTAKTIRQMLNDRIAIQKIRYGSIKASVRNYVCYLEREIGK